MKSIPSFPIVVLAMVAALLAAALIKVVYTEEKIHSDFKKYFSMDVHAVSEERSLVQPLIDARLNELLNSAKKASAAVKAIYEEKSDSPTIEVLNDKLSRLKIAKDKEKELWSNWLNACKAAKYEEYAKSCDAAK